MSEQLRTRIAEARALADGMNADQTYGAATYRRLADALERMLDLCDQWDADATDGSPCVEVTVYGFGLGPDAIDAFEDRVFEAAHSRDEEVFGSSSRGDHILASVPTRFLRAALAGDPS